MRILDGLFVQKKSEERELCVCVCACVGVWVCGWGCLFEYVCVGFAYMYVRVNALLPNPISSNHPRSFSSFPFLFLSCSFPYLKSVRKSEMETLR